MPMIRVIEPGMLTTVQDLGRPGHGSIGVPPSGAADPLALIIGNRLLSNTDDAAALECTMFGPSITLDHDSWVCLTGAPCPNAAIGGRGGVHTLPWCEPVMVRAGELMKVGQTEGGARAYLCLASNIDVPIVLGSRSTLVGAALGGYQGRALRKDDQVPLCEPRHHPRPLPAGLSEWIHTQRARAAIRVTPSIHTELFATGTLEQLASTEYAVKAQSNRVGIRLNGPPIPRPTGSPILQSEPTVAGGIQIPGDGRPIVLGVDRPTTGGYPLLASVIRADLPMLGVLRPLDTVRFKICTIDEARGISAEQRDSLDEILTISRDGRCT